MSKISPSLAQKITIQAYNDHVEEYIRKERSDEGRTVAYWGGIEVFLNHLPAHSRIFEVGSGTGADAARIEREGFSVQRSDATPAFVELLQRQDATARHFDILRNALEEKQTAILANAVFLHFTTSQFRRALDNVRKSLLPGGLFCIGMKLGEFEGWREKGLSGKRYFKFWQAADLERELAQADFTVINTSITTDDTFVITTAQLRS